MAAALGRGSTAPLAVSGGEGGGLITRLRVHLLLCRPVRLAGLSLQGLGAAESQERMGLDSH